MKMRLRMYIFSKIFSELIGELNRQRWLGEANSDIHFLNLPFTIQIEEHAYQNARTFEPDLVSGKATIQDRLTSLIEVLKRENLIQEAQ